MDHKIVLRASVLLVVLALASAVTVRAAVHTQTFMAVKTTARPPDDAVFDAPVWRNALTLTGFYDFTTRQPARHATVVHMLYDDRNIYVAIQAEQQGVPITATQTVDHVGLSQDDRIVIQIDTSANGQRHYEFSSSPKGVHNEYSAENSRYAPAWTSIGRILPSGDYNILMVIPLSNMRMQSSQLQRWRFNVIRVIAATNETYTWAFEPTQNSLDSELNWPVLDGMHISARTARSRPQADLYVLASGGSDHDLYQGSLDNFQTHKTRPAGLDVTYPITNSLAFIGTVNPDFSNVEVDQTTIAPQEFQRNLTEYRPFFAQGARYVNTISNPSVNGIAPSLFYTPAIGFFDSGEKVEGTIGHSSIGALDVAGSGFHDDAFGYAYQDSVGDFSAQIEGVKANHLSVDDNTFGLAVSRSNLRSGERSTVSIANENGTLVDHPGAAQSISAAELFQTQRWTAGLVWNDIGPEFNPLDGLTPINDIRGFQPSVTYTGAAGSGSSVKSYSLTAIADRFLDRRGAVRDADVVTGTSVTFKNLLSVSLTSNSTELRSTRFNQTSLSIGYRDGTPSPIDISYSTGLFGANAAGDQLFTQQFAASLTRAVGTGYTVGFDFGGTVERIAKLPALSSDSSPTLDSQWLRRLSLTRSFDKDTSLAIGLRTINGMGGFGTPGANIAISFHRRFRNEDQLYIDYGTQAANQTLHRLILKYVFHAGGETGS